MSTETKLTDSDWNLIRATIEGMIAEEMSSLMRVMKNNRDTLLNMLETHASTTDFTLKEINYKLGAIAGHKTRDKKANAEADPVFTNFEDAQRWAETKRAEALNKIKGGPGAVAANLHDNLKPK